MAELLVYNGDHWMDKLDADTLAERLKDAAFAAKYDRRIRRGDIIQVYKDGTCKEKPSPNSKMTIVRVPDMSVEEALELQASSRIDVSPEDTAKTTELTKLSLVSTLTADK